ncbi:electron transfer flavoprotein subunit alpha/FixB family protein [Anaerosinus massiliensis]|uniref:electron transfer flavoprotein subunit alpha/FixB family protein n=1 Tax=Massilibacillus massiliensis TaxID=1806837 RepID=UPI000DA60388|nr:electron transfer flavoprotein subunit alpha/FixB family protein [Massilibacillus massiliensis]
MAGILVYSEDHAVAQQLLTIGRTLADAVKVSLVAVTLEEENVVHLITKGADKAIVLEGKNMYPESYAKPIAEVIEKEKPTVILIGGTLRGKEAAAKIAAYLNTALVNSACSIKVSEGNIETERIMYGGLAVCTEIVASGSLVTIEPLTYEAAMADASHTGTIEKMAVQAEALVTIERVCPMIKQCADIRMAEKLICVGRGLSKQEDMKLAQDLAEQLGAEIGCTRSIAEDYHWLPNGTYIGLSGQKVRPNLYISMGVSGQVQHVSGIRDAKLIVAIDRNENAPIFQSADYGIVGDLQEIVPLLTEKISK